MFKLNFTSPVLGALFIACLLQVTPASAAGIGTLLTSGELQVIDTRPGSGKEARHGNLIEVHYTGWLFDAAAPGHKGTRFDSSLDRNNTFQFQLNMGAVIKGWDKGILGMKEGGKRTLVIPAAMAYGSRGAGRVIPPNAPLLFEVELVEVK